MNGEQPMNGGNVVPKLPHCLGIKSQYQENLSKKPYAGGFRCFEHTPHRPKSIEVIISASLQLKPAVFRERICKGAGRKIRGIALNSSTEQRSAPI